MEWSKVEIAGYPYGVYLENSHEGKLLLEKHIIAEAQELAKSGRSFAIYGRCFTNGEAYTAGRYGFFIQEVNSRSSRTGVYAVFSNSKAKFIQELREAIVICCSEHAFWELAPASRRGVKLPS